MVTTHHWNSLSIMPTSCPVPKSEMWPSSERKPTIIDLSCSDNSDEQTYWNNRYWKCSGAMKQSLIRSQQHPAQNPPPIRGNREKESILHGNEERCMETRPTKQKEPGFYQAIRYGSLWSLKRIYATHRNQSLHEPEVQWSKLYCPVLFYVWEYSSL